MTPYRSKSGKPSGVTAYEAGEDYIKVKFTNGKTYKYPASLNGQATINQMIALALAGSGLSTYIAQHKLKLRYT